MKWSRVITLLQVALAASPLTAQAQADTVVLRVTSPRGRDVAFSGVVTLREGKTERRFDNVKTPFELRLPAEDLDARFTAADGGALSGEVMPFRAGKQNGYVSGTIHRGAVQLYFDRRQGFGFGGRREWNQVSEP
jgi:hypothetical protein